MAIDSLDKLNEFKNVFNVDLYKKYAFRYKVKQVLLYNRNAFAKDNVDFAKSKGKKIPSYFVCLLLGIYYGFRFILIMILQKLLPKKQFKNLKKLFGK